MTYDEIKKALAPCALSCVKCMGFSKGDIKRHSTELVRLLGNFETYAERFSKFMPVFSNYGAFKELLAYFAGASCRGCRAGDCKYPGCVVPGCTADKGVDFCFRCGDFPCKKTNFDPNLKARWVKMNTRMKEIGVEAYWEETKDLPRYR